jgi:hypothetical protein
MDNPSFDPAIAVRFFELFAIIAPFEEDAPFSAVISKDERGLTVAFSVYVEPQFYSGPEDLPVLGFTSDADQFDEVERILGVAVAAYQKELPATKEARDLREQILAKLTPEERRALGFPNAAEQAEWTAALRTKLDEFERQGGKPDPIEPTEPDIGQRISGL